MRPLLVLLAPLLLPCLPGASAEPVVTLSLTNNQPFPLRIPIEIRNAGADATCWLSADNHAAQTDGTKLILVADLPAGANQQLQFHPGPSRTNSELRLEPVTNGVSLNFHGSNLGRLSWALSLREIPRQRADAEVQTTRQDFDADFAPLPLDFKRTAAGPVFECWTSTATKNGLRLNLELRPFHEGFLDIRGRLTNESATRTNNVYAAVVCLWEQSNYSSRTIDYDNHITPMAENAWSQFREGEGRHLFLQRGADWIRTTFNGGAVAAWLNDFSPSFTVPAAATARTPAHFTAANLPQLGQEAQTVKERLYSITEIARSTSRGFRDRMKENILPPRGQSVSFASRIALGDTKLDDQRADELFVGWTSYNQQQPNPDGKFVAISFGTRAIRFGTSYFPYSTLGESFDTQKLPGMDRESFWPLAADTVNQWHLFADDIRRDLRIAKAMGFQLIRLHHLELLAPIEKKIRQEYLDFLFGEMRHLQLKALLDVYSSPEQITELLTRYRDVVDAIEIENEVLIWGIQFDRPDEWKGVYAAVKKAAPDIPVHFTGYGNTGMFDRLSAQGVPFDRVCLHAYIDSLDAIPSGRGYSLSLSSYASKTGKPPLITEWNWRSLTRMTPEARAKIYPQIIESAIATRGIPDFYQFQFNETLCPNPRVGRGNILRHYELLHLSRRPKPEALALMDLIRKYSPPNDPLRQLTVQFPIVQLDSKGRGMADVSVLNNTSNTLILKATLETGGGLNATLESPADVSLAPGASQNLRVTLTATNPVPGFYYCFARIEGDNGLLRYAVVEAQLPGPPKFDLQPPPRDWTKPCTVVYGKESSVLEVETAIAIAETLESATGREVEALQSDEVPKSRFERNNLLLVGTPSTHNLLAGLKLPAFNDTNGFSGMISDSTARSCLVITGADSRQVENAGMNFILSYWKNAKDSAARRVGLVTKELPRGVDATKLP